MPGKFIRAIQTDPVACRDSAARSRRLAQHVSDAKVRSALEDLASDLEARADAAQRWPVQDRDKDACGENGGGPSQ